MRTFSNDAQGNRFDDEKAAARVSVRGAREKILPAGASAGVKLLFDAGWWRSWSESRSSRVNRHAVSGHDAPSKAVKLEVLQQPIRRGCERPGNRRCGCGRGARTAEEAATIFRQKIDNPDRWGFATHRSEQKINTHVLVGEYKTAHKLRATKMRVPEDDASTLY